MEYIAFEHNTAAAELVRSAYDTPPLAFVHSYGCQQNVNDGERIKGVLVDIGYGLCDKPEDADLMYVWENDCDVWAVSGTTEPFSHYQMQRFVERHQDIVGVLCDGQLRLIIETLLSSKPVGAIDLFEYDPIHRRAGIGILIYEQSDRGRGYASDAVETLCRYAHDTLRAHQLWCNVGADNEASLRLFRSAGFTEIGVKRDWLWRPNGYHDEVMLQKIFD